MSKVRGGERSYPASEVSGGERSYPASGARGGGPEEPPHAGGQRRWSGGATQGAVAAQVQEGLEELSHIEQ